MFVAKQKKTHECGWENEPWYQNLKPDGKHVADLICKYHHYFKNKDKTYRNTVFAFKTVILFLSMLSTIVLGVKTINNTNIQVVIGLILSSIITFLTGITGYFNFEKYWMRNIAIHIQLNVLRDNFAFDAVANKLDDAKLAYYMRELDNIQRENKDYWEKAIKKI